MINNKALYSVILAGGKGERLWPLSREQFPKQLLLLSQKSLLEHTYDRLSLCVAPENSAVVTIVEQSEGIKKAVPQSAIIMEPCARNTAPALLLSCLKIAASNPDACIIFSPADHYIVDNHKFISCVQEAVKQSEQHDVITLIGVKPTHPATGYGYIEFASVQHGISKVVRFHEKPSLEKAQNYCKVPNMLWNIGIFCAKASVFIEHYKRLAPELYGGVMRYFVTGNEDEYAALPSISVDYAIMEKSNDLLVIPAEFEWSDVGNLATFISLNSLPVLSQKEISIDAHNNLVMAKNSLTVLIGVDDLCVVQTDDVLLIARREDVEKVKLAVNELKKNKLERYL